MKKNFKQLLTIGMLPVCGVCFAANDSSVAMTSNKSAFFGASSFTDVVSLPGFSLSAPSGMVSSAGVAYVGMSGISKQPYSSHADGALSAGIGFGDAQEFLGGSIDVGIGSINPEDGGAFERGNIGGSVGHFSTDHLLGVAVGVQNATGWNAGGGNPDPSFYVAATKVLSNDVAPVMLNLGVGNNGYVDLNDGGKTTHKIDVFGSVAVYITPQISLIADYTSGVTSIGASLVPMARVPLTVNLGVWDVLEDLDGSEMAFTGSITYAFVF